jgi:hypothetical protein
MEKRSKVSINAFQMKIIALILYFAGMTMVQLTYAHYSDGNFDDGPWAILYIIGSIVVISALPPICFLTVEAVLKTGDLKKLFIRLGTAAVITEILLDLAAYGGKVFDFSEGILKNPAFSMSLNLYFSMILGAAVVCVMDRVIKKKYSPGSVPFVLFNILFALVCCAVAVFLNTAHGSLMILMMVAVYYFYGNPVFTVICICLLQFLSLGNGGGILMLAPILGCVPIWLYSGEEGRKTNVIRLLTYIAFPVCYGAVLLVLRFMGDRI